MPDPISQRCALFILQGLRSYPHMMLRIETFPPFIHTKVHQSWSSHGPALPEALGNCIGIAQMFVSRTSETTPFIWRTIREEQYRLLKQIDKFTNLELLAAIQAFTMYVIMRITDEEAEHAEEDFATLRSFQALCLRYCENSGGPICRHELHYPSSSWAEWVVAESLRRVAVVWFLFDRIVCIRTGTLCEITGDFRALPLPSSKILWEAENEGVWRSEQNHGKSTTNNGFLSFGDLIDAQRRTQHAESVRKLDAWTSRVDGLSTLLAIATVMV
ncbi:uncharacterized protein BDZ99DRAFT_429042 [Mytilinidion resinicola]|uniref:Xylanolytic transcriptional activator regulatory domain-containing protein n=1 Tax=Mytilinidion resinicola TaxID=574789 RepID=A0A6A6Y2C0_9PEZI|nr:uncharacterized protein BDZ99DRAFT_429042 [Mytilinidion resinicola]KAF2802154.1 hypothetical protein BDZ99DRAFT_429042 [Mytilinidion resinicola]